MSNSALEDGEIASEADASPQPISGSENEDDEIIIDEIIQNSQQPAQRILSPKKRRSSEGKSSRNRQSKKRRQRNSDRSIQAVSPKAREPERRRESWQGNARKERRPPPPEDVIFPPPPGINIMAPVQPPPSSNMYSNGFGRLKSLLNYNSDIFTPPQPQHPPSSAPNFYFNPPVTPIGPVTMMFNPPPAQPQPLKSSFTTYRSNTPEGADVINMQPIDKTPIKIIPLDQLPPPPAPPVIPPKPVESDEDPDALRQMLLSQIKQKKRAAQKTPSPDADSRKKPKTSMTSSNVPVKPFAPAKLKVISPPEPVKEKAREPPASAAKISMFVPIPASPMHVAHGCTSPPPASAPAVLKTSTVFKSPNPVTPEDVPMRPKSPEPVTPVTLPPRPKNPVSVRISEAAAAAVEASPAVAPAAPVAPVVSVAPVAPEKPAAPLETTAEKQERLDSRINHLNGFIKTSQAQIRKEHNEMKSIMERYKVLRESMAKARDSIKEAHAEKKDLQNQLEELDNEELDILCDDIEFINYSGRIAQTPVKNEPPATPATSTPAEKKFEEEAPKIVVEQPLPVHKEVEEVPREEQVEHEDMDIESISSDSELDNDKTLSVAPSPTGNAPPVMNQTVKATAKSSGLSAIQKSLNEEQSLREKLLARCALPSFRSSPELSVVVSSSSPDRIESCRNFLLKLCKFELNGNCVRGRDCTFVHLYNITDESQQRQLLEGIFRELLNYEESKIDAGIADLLEMHPSFTGFEQFTKYFLAHVMANNHEVRNRLFEFFAAPV